MNDKQYEALQSNLEKLISSQATMQDTMQELEDKLAQVHADLRTTKRHTELVGRDQEELLKQVKKVLRNI